MQHKWPFIKYGPSYWWRPTKRQSWSTPISLVYINDLPNCLTSASPRIFANDTNITFAASIMTDLENAVNLELRNLQRWLITKWLSLNIAETEFMVIESNQRIHTLSNNQIDIEIDGKSIKKAKEAKSQGLLIDEHLSWAKHIEEISKKISSAIGALKRIRPFISESTALQIYQALILPHFDYCSPRNSKIGLPGSSPGRVTTLVPVSS